MTNEGMVNDYHLARKRCELGYMFGSGGVVGICLNFIILWPFHNTSTWFIQGFVAALSIAFFISAHDYAKRADDIEKAWRQAYNRPG